MAAGLFGDLSVDSLHKPGLAPGSSVRMDNPTLGGLIEYAHSLIEQRGCLIGLFVHRRFGLLYECLDFGPRIEVPEPALSRLLNVFNNRFNIWQLGLTPCLCRRDY